MIKRQSMDVFLAGFLVGMEDKKEVKGNAENSICSQAHIILSREVEILRKSDSKLGNFLIYYYFIFNDWI